MTPSIERRILPGFAEQLMAGHQLGQRIAIRSAALFAEERAALTRRTDQLFAWLMSLQWLAIVAATLWISPRAWTELLGQANTHVYAAVVLGGIITALPVLFAVFRPGRPITRHVIAVGQMLTSALLIHLMGGRIQTHFHVFGSLAFLAFYRDWRVLFTAFVVIWLDHFLGGVFWPQSVYGVLTAPAWEALEHTGWAAFEGLVLLVFIRRSLEASRETAERRAQAEASREVIEQEVERRTHELRESEERFRSLSASSPIGIFETDAEGRCDYTNARWQAMSGRSFEENLGDGWSHAVHPDDSERVAAEWREAIQAGREYGAQYRMRTPDGVVRWVHARAAPICEPDGAIRGYVGTLEDISEGKELEAQLVHASEAAMATARLKSEFVANMSHEIRTPMTSIIGMTELALDTGLTRDQREYLTAVKGSADALLTVLNDVLDFSKIEAGKLELEAIPFSLRECVGNALKSMAIRVHQKGLELACHVTPETPDRLVGDPARLRQVILNLVGNAIKFTERGEIVMQVEANAEIDDRATLQFSVQDTGIGIPEEKQKLIFESFTQADGSTTRRHGGTGLGLTICRQLVQLMGGEITVRSVPDQGSTFTFSALFPIEPAVAIPPQSVASLHGRRILVVDDNATNRSIFTTLLHRWQAHPLAVEDGPAALAALKRARDAGTPFELVLLDVRMPGTDGITVAEQIKQDARLEVSIVLLTSAGQTGDAARCRALGISGYLTKPVMSGELLEAIRAVFGGISVGQSDTFVTVHSLRENRHRLRLLLAEDNPVNRSMIARMLEKRGHYVCAVENGRQILAALEKESFELILMDVEMPELDGIETTTAIREQERGTGRRIPIVALTAHAMKGDRERCLEHGMDGYASKPIQPRELFAVIEQLIPRPKTAAASEDQKPARASHVLDMQTALLYADGDGAMLAEVVRLYVDDAPRRIEQMETSLQQGEARALERAAHGLKGALAQIGAQAAAEAAQRLESVSASGDIRASRPAFLALRFELERLTPALEDLLKAA